MELALYEDGVETGRVAVTGAIGPRGGTFKIGEKFIGTIDEVKLFNRALSAQEVRTAVNGPDAAIEPHDKLTSKWGYMKLSLSD